MKRTQKILVLAALAAIISCSALQGAERGRNGRLRGTFVGMTEREVGGRGYTGIVVKPLDSDENVILLLPSNRERLVQAAQKLPEGQRLGISFVTEDGQKWIDAMDFERRTREGNQGGEGERRTIVRTEIGRNPEEIERQRQNRQERASRPAPDAERDRVRDMERRQPRREPSYIERFDAQLREITGSYMERMRGRIREAFMEHIERTEMETRELRRHIENMERQMQELRAENERLRMELRERGRIQRQETEIMERRELDRRREAEPRAEREVLRERDRRTDRNRPAEERPTEEREVPRDNGQRR